MRSLVLLACSSVAFAQSICPYEDECIQGRGFIFAADRRVFAVMAFLNAAGFDSESKGETMDPIRQQVRAMVAEKVSKHPEKLKAWREWYLFSDMSGGRVFSYLDYALALTPQRPFRLAYPEEKLSYPATAKMYRQLPGILEDFWKTAELDEVWTAIKPGYVKRLRAYDADLAARELAFVWEYLRMPRRDSFTIVNIPNPLDQRFHSIGANYGDYYYSVESTGSHGRGLNVHEYLHSVVNDLVKAHFDNHAQKLTKYFEAGKSGPWSQSYRERRTFAYECLIRAIDERLELRMGAKDEASVLAAVRSATQGGLNLTEPFYRLLPQFEASDLPFDRFLPVLLSKLPPLTDPK